MIHRHENHLRPSSSKYVNRAGIARSFQVDSISRPHKRPGHQIDPLLGSAGNHQIRSSEVDSAQLQMPAHDLPQLRIALEIAVGGHQFRLAGYEGRHGCTDRPQRQQFFMDCCKMERVLHLGVAEIAP
ncbi:hypothetical protein D3C74_411840 [compost metagenome]